MFDLSVVATVRFASQPDYTFFEGRVLRLLHLSLKDAVRRETTPPAEESGVAGGRRQLVSSRGSRLGSGGADR